jgi:predicted RNase H-like HicB family nuclease
MPLRLEVEQEEDGRWIAEVPELPGVMVYGSSRSEAIGHVQALALRVLVDRLEHGEPVPQMASVFAVAQGASGVP